MSIYSSVRENEMMSRERWHVGAGGDLGLTVLTAGGGPSSAGFSGLSLQSRAME